MKARFLISARSLALILALVLLLDATCFAQSELTFPDAAPRFLHNRTSVTLPAKFINHRIYIETPFTNRRMLWLALDTGAAFSFIVPQAVRQLELKTRRLNGKEVLTYVDLPLSFPQLEIAQQRFLTSLVRQTPDNSAGVLGADFIRNFVLEINYPQQLVTLHHKTKFSFPPAINREGWQEVSLTLEGGCPHISVKLNYLNDASESFTALIDTGYNGSVLFTNELADKLENKQLLIENIEFGNLSFSNIGCCNNRVPVHALSRPPFPYQVLLGGRLLENLQIILDDEHAKLYVRRARL